MATPKPRRRVSSMFGGVKGAPGTRRGLMHLGGPQRARRASVEFLSSLGRRAQAGAWKAYASQITREEVRLLTLPPHYRSREDCIQLADALSWLPIFSGLEIPVVRNLVKALRLLQIPQYTKWHFSDTRTKKDTESDEDDSDEEPEETGLSSVFSKGRKVDPIDAFVMLINGKAQFRHKKKLKKLDGVQMVHQAVLLFEEIDDDGSGEIDAGEILLWLENQGVTVTDKEVRKIMKSFAGQDEAMTPTTPPNDTKRTKTAQGMGVITEDEDGSLSPKKVASGENQPVSQENDETMECHIEMEEEEVIPGITFPVFLEAMQKTNGKAAWLDEVLMNKELKDVFTSIDEDGSGEIDEEELTKALKALHINTAEADLKQYFVDEKGCRVDGMDFKAFKRLFRRLNEQQENTLDEMSVGSSVGQYSIMDDEEWTEDGYLHALEDTKMLVIEKSEYKRVIKEGYDSHLSDKLTLMQRLPHFMECENWELDMLAYFMEVRYMQRGERVCEQGATLEQLYFIFKGVCSGAKEVDAPDHNARLVPISNFRPHLKNAKGAPKKQSVVVMQLRQGECFGDQGVFRKEPMAFAVIASEPCTLFTLHQDDLDFMQNKFKDGLRSQAEMKEEYRKPRAQLMKEHSERMAKFIGGRGLEKVASELNLPPVDDEATASEDEDPMSAPGSPRRPMTVPAAWDNPEASYSSFSSDVYSTAVHTRSGPMPASRSEPKLDPVLMGPVYLSKASGNAPQPSKTFLAGLAEVLQEQRSHLPPTPGDMTRHVMEYMQDNLVMRLRESARSKSVNDTRTPSAFDSSGGFNGTTAASNPLTGQGLLRTLPHLHTVGQYKTSWMIRHAMDGDVGSGDFKYARRHAVPTMAPIQHDNLRRTLLTDPTWHPGASPRLKLSAARRAEFELGRLKRAVKAQTPSRWIPDTPTPLPRPESRGALPPTYGMPGPPSRAGLDGISSFAGAVDLQ